MALHFDKNGIGSVTPNYLYHDNGVVSDPLQRSGAISHLPDANGNVADHSSASGHPWFGGNRSSLIIGQHR